MLPVGQLIGVSGATVLVGRGIYPSLDVPDGTPTVPSSGTICLYVNEELSTLRRERAALRQLSSAESPNPRLVEILTDLRRAEFDEPDDQLPFFQEEMASDKREAVRQALAARDLFLIQGPPGTGKTTVIAEIVLQLLHANPSARILVSSQSNVPVNHVLSKVAGLHKNGDGNLEIIRLGRSEKIGQGAQVWQLEQRLESWRAEIVSHCDRKRSELTTQIRQKSRERRSEQATLTEENLQLCHEWLEEASDRLQSLVDEEDRLSLLRKERSGTGSSQASAGHENLAESEIRSLMDAVFQRRQDLEDDVEAVFDLLPEGHRGVPVADLEKEIARLKEIVARLSAPDEDDPTYGLRRLIDDWKTIFGLTREFEAPLLRRARVLAATCLFSGGRILRDQVYDWVIVDEAGRATGPELLVPLVRARRAILVGDERQLPPMLDEEIAPEQLQKAGVRPDALEKSLFETLVLEALQNAPSALRMLTVQHRMHPSIGQLISDVFYEGRLTHGVSEDEREHGLVWIDRPVVWFSTSKMMEREEARRGTSFANNAEITIIEHLLEWMEEDYRQQRERREIGVIAGYSGQVVELVGRIEPASDHRWRSLDVEIATVDAFQGRDRDIIIYSTVRSNREAVIGFLRDRRRLNVALSRARQLLVLVGDAAMFGSGSLSSGRNPFHDVLAFMDAHPESCTVVDWTREFRNRERA